MRTQFFTPWIAAGFIGAVTLPAFALDAGNPSMPRDGATFVLAQAETTSQESDRTPDVGANDAKTNRSDGQVINTSKPATVDGVRGQNTDQMTPGDMSRDARSKSAPVERDQTGADKTMLPGDMKRTVEDSSGKTKVTK